MAEPRPLFSCYGVELEYMIVDAKSLDVRPIADGLFVQALIDSGRGELARAPTGDVEFEDISWSNELSLHLVEFKTAQPASSLEGLAARFQAHVTRANALLADFPGGPSRLLPGAMHPWMDPARDMMLWPHDYADVYARFDEMFDCRGHGWSNLQSVHLNLPFHGDLTPDDEFGRLHAAIRLLLPLLPALAASSPFMDGRATGRLDNRLEVYRGNARKIPVVSGRVIPEPAFTREAYDRLIYAPIDAAIAAFNRDGLLDHTWVNSRGAIARFDRSAIEIRVLDVQECPAADLAMVATIVETLKSFVGERWSSLATQQAFTVDRLATLLGRTIDHADMAIIDDAGYLEALGVPKERAAAPMTARDVWQRLTDASPPASEHQAWLEMTMRDGPLARRLVRAAGTNPGREKLQEAVLRLAECLRNGTLFRA